MCAPLRRNATKKWKSVLGWPMAKSKRQKHNVFDVFLEIMYGFNKKMTRAQIHRTMSRLTARLLRARKISIFTMKTYQHFQKHQYFVWKNTTLRTLVAKRSSLSVVGSCLAAAIRWLTRGHKYHNWVAIKNPLMKKKVRPSATKCTKKMKTSFEMAAGKTQTSKTQGFWYIFEDYVRI